MTTPVKIIASHQRQLAAQGFGYMAELAKRLDFFDEKSELTQLNNSAGLGPRVVSPLLYRLLRLAKLLELKTNKVFRADFESSEKSENFTVANYPRVQLKKGCRINLGGIAKGFIVDQTYQYLKRSGAQNILVEAGGDIRARSAEQAWKIGLLNPLNTDQAFGALNLSRGAIVTSGTYARKNRTGDGTHFFNTRTWSYFTETPYLSVTVQGPTAAISEVYAKCLLMGQNLQLPKNYQALGITSNYKVKFIGK